MSQRSDALADRLEQGARALAKFAIALTETEWHGDAPLTCQFVLEDHAVRHSFHHLAVLRGTVKRRLSAARAS